jgi:UDP-N-acetylmuramoyl-L-alanyl-D-glutamate--2,6-diaminopimelate ligase
VGQQDAGKAARAVLERLREQGVNPPGLAADSRSLVAGEVFLAYPGERADGRDFIAQAVAAGAAGVVWERNGFEWPPGTLAPNVAASDVRSLAGWLGHEVYGRPSERLWTVGVTGTNGKTTTSQWIAQALSASGVRTAVVGTLGLGLPGALAQNPNTTPDAVLLQRALAAFADAGTEAVSIEVSSIGLDQGRVNGVAFDVALFTNLSRDHLDYHGTMDAYGEAKVQLFTMPGVKHAVLNLDDALGVRIAGRTAAEVERVGYSIADGAGRRSGLERWLEAKDIAFGRLGLSFRLESSWGEAAIEAPCVGRFNVANLLGVIGVLLVSGTSLEAIPRLVRQLQPVAGRMQPVGGGDGAPLIVIDYAHSPDALDKVLGALGDVARARGGQLVCVFGCGGDRDRGKRPLMGQAASRHAQRVVVTSDNPRSEEPQAIVDEILPGVTVPHVAIVDRRDAIRAAVLAASPEDVIVIAGKGHEPYQEIAGERRAFSDLAEARAALEARP